MDKILIEGKVSEKRKKIILSIVIISAIIALIFVIINLISYYSIDNVYVWNSLLLDIYGSKREYVTYLRRMGDRVPYIHGFFKFPWIYIAFDFLLISICFLLYYFKIKQMQIIVTEKCVYGKTNFGRKVDLPLDSISSVASRRPKGIAIATSSGKISFLFIDKSNEIHELLRNLMIERQEKKERSTKKIDSDLISSADELKKYKELLDMGVITQEEFDVKKKQLLGL